MIRLLKLSTFRQFYAAVIANLGILCLGCIYGWTSSALKSLEEEFSLNVFQKSWISSIINVGGITSCLSAGFVIDKFGRKSCSLVFLIPLFGGYILLIFAQNVWMLITSRFILGFAASFYGAIVPVFVAEISEPRIRGALGNFYEVFLTLGLLFSYTVGAFAEWRLLTMISATLPILLFFGLLLIPESPRFLFHIGKEEEAIRNLCWYRGTSSEEDVFQEMKEMTDEGKGTREPSSSSFTLSLLMDPGAYKPLIICLLLTAFEQFSGFAAIVAFTSQIFESVGYHGNADEMAIYFGLFQVASTTVSCFLVDSVGRRPLLLMGQACMTASLGILGLYFYTLPGILISQWIPAICLLTYVVTCNLGIAPIATTMMAEILPQRIRGLGSSLCTVVLRGSAFLVSFTYEWVSKDFGSEYLFWFFAIICFIAFIFILTFVPETKGKSLEEISSLFNDKKIRKEKGMSIAIVPNTNTIANLL